jgi:chemotaxis protein CheZ
MGDPVKTQESSDSAELEALFDSIAADSSKGAPPPAAALDGDSNELQALFDSVSEQSVSVALDAGDSSQDRVFNRLGQMARQLHDALRELGYDKMLENTAKAIPDARQRLSYIAQMTEQAASRVLNATDIAKPLQDEMLVQTTDLAARWDKVYANELTVEEFKQLANATRDYFNTAQEKHRVTNEHLMEIVMAQDFQDLTGQVIMRVVDMAQQMEASLVGVLIEAIPAARKADAPEGLLNGPVMDAVGRNDVVSSQGQVDDLLESLGF